MELLDVEPVRLADPLTGAAADAATRRIAWAVAALVALRVVTAAVLPLSFDEAYYWLWSKHLAAGYYDHPPLVAFAIRLGTLAFGDTAFGVRAASQLLSLVATWAVWRAGASVLASERGGALAALFFNLTLMATVETMTATPDAPLLAGAAVFLWTLARLAETRDGRWWLAAGAAAGLALLAKYTALFLGLGAATWLVATRDGRRWLATPWPWLGGLVALALAAPVVLWNAHHGWVSLRFQLGKAGGGHFGLAHLGGFLTSQTVLASPFVLVLAVLGLRPGRGGRFALPAAMVVPAGLFFLQHALHGKVQANWPDVLYPALAVAAAAAALAAKGRIARISRAGAVPVAAVLLAVAYFQAWTGLLPVRDPSAFLLAKGFTPVARRIAALRAETHAAAILTTNYAPTGWLAFYLPDHPPVIQLNAPYRWLATPRAGPALLDRPLLYVTEPRRDDAALVARHFAHVRPIARIKRTRRGRVVARYTVYLVSGRTGAPAGHVVNAP